MLAQRDNVLSVVAKAVAVVFAVPVLLVLLEIAGIFGIRYLRPVENIPFDNPVTVSSVGDQKILLTDGRKIVLPIPVDDYILGEIEQSENILGIGPESNSGVTIYARRRRTICGIGQPIIVVPLIPSDVPKYQRREILQGCSIE